MNNNRTTIILVTVVVAVIAIGTGLAVTLFSEDVSLGRGGQPASPPVIAPTPTIESVATRTEGSIDFGSNGVIEAPSLDLAAANALQLIGVDQVAQTLRRVEPSLQVVIPPLLLLLSNENTAVRLFGINVLEELGPAAAAAAPALEPLLQDQTGSVRSAAANALARIERGSGKTLLRALEDPDPGLRQTALTVLNKVELPQAPYQAVLFSLTGDTDPTVRKIAVTQLTELPVSVSLPEMIRILEEDAAWEVREAAALGLAGLGRDAEPAIPDLILALQDQVPSVRSSAVRALTEIGPNATVALLLTLANDPNLTIELAPEPTPTSQPTVTLTPTIPAPTEVAAARGIEATPTALQSATVEATIVPVTSTIEATPTTPISATIVAVTSTIEATPTTPISATIEASSPGITVVLTLAAEAASTETAAASPTAPAPPTATPTSTPSPTPQPTATETVPPTATPEPTATPSPTPSPTPTVTPIPTPVTLGVTVVAVAGANLRATPNTNAQVVTVLLNGTQTTAVQRTGNGEWLQLLLPNQPEQSGWVFAELVEVDGDAQTLPVLP